MGTYWPEFTSFTPKYFRRFFLDFELFSIHLSWVLMDIGGLCFWNLERGLYLPWFKKDVSWIDSCARCIWVTRFALLEWTMFPIIHNHLLFLGYLFFSIPFLHHIRTPWVSLPLLFVLLSLRVYIWNIVLFF